MYLVSQSEESEELDNLIQLLISDFRDFAPLTLANLAIRGFWDSSVFPEKMGIIRVATPVEQDLLKLDIVISVNKETVEGFSEEGVANLLAELLNKIDISFSKSKLPTLKIVQRAYELSPNLVRYFGKSNDYGKDFFNIVDNTENPDQVFSLEPDELERGPFDIILP